jgi:hypothetical protein
VLSLVIRLNDGIDHHVSPDAATNYRDSGARSLVEAAEANQREVAGVQRAIEKRAEDARRGGCLVVILILVAIAAIWIVALATGHVPSGPLLDP